MPKVNEFLGYVPFEKEPKTLGEKNSLLPLAERYDPEGTGQAASR